LELLERKFIEGETVFADVEDGRVVFERMQNTE